MTTEGIKAVFLETHNWGKAAAFTADPAVDVVAPFEDTHYGTREMIVRDPDGRLCSLQAPGKS